MEALLFSEKTSCVLMFVRKSVNVSSFIIEWSQFTLWTVITENT